MKLVTLNSPGALYAIERVANELGDEILVGAGTVLDPESAQLAISAGAKFILSPTVNLETIKLTKRYGVVSIPGALTPTEILTAYEQGADMIKLFPALVGADYIKAIQGPCCHSYHYLLQGEWILIISKAFYKQVLLDLELVVPS